jgi:hypothetical protein
MKRMEQLRIKVVSPQQMHQQQTSSTSNNNRAGYISPSQTISPVSNLLWSGNQKKISRSMNTGQNKPTTPLSRQI